MPTTQFPYGKLSKIKSSTVFPDGWRDTKIINNVENIGNFGTAPNGMKIRLFIASNGRIISAFPIY
ncbi:EndoU domain-containing protein [Bacillus cereus group sp. BfR-BA-01310]|uniref:EndoU domain-containing protein n=1 Tax=Bacillus cereus group sp. BfR-BA-01310 TaxID=2920287 RepID=UPI001F56CF0B|nr:EndoU domain-containing protein [Bacillus cereus group sp. BfR-BA-01310]